MAPKDKSMSREQATELYQDLNKAMQTLHARKGGAAPAASASKGKGDAASKAELAKTIAKEISRSMARDPEVEPVKAAFETPTSINRGHAYALSFVLLFAASRVAWSALELSGIAKVSTAEASVASRQPAQSMMIEKPAFSKEEIVVLKKLDQRRVELEERDAKLESREHELQTQDRILTTKLAQLRELTDSLKMERDKGEKKKNAQLDQLANVYGSMTPQEAAKLIEQLDVVIGLSLLERMPEKRVGQILALMSSEKALTMTKILSEKK